MPWATPQDVRDRWLGSKPPAASEQQLTTLIADAEDSILREFPDIQARITAGTLPSTRVVKVVSRMVIRHLRNPEGIRATQEGAGPYQVSRTYGGDEPGALTLTDEDRAELAPPQESGAFAIDTAPGGGSIHSPICSLNFGAAYCSCGAVLTGDRPLYEVGPW